MALGMEVLRQGSFHGIAEQSDEADSGEQGMYAFRSLGMEEVKGGDVSSLLSPASVLVMRGVPAWGFIGMQAEVVHLFAWRQIHPWMLFQQFLQAGGSPFLSAENQEMGKPLPDG